MPPRKKRKKVDTSTNSTPAETSQPTSGAMALPKLIGAHVSMSGGIWRAVENAVAIGAGAFALDTRSKRQWNSKPIPPEDAVKFKDLAQLHQFPAHSILPHGSYLINLGSPDEEMLEKSRNAFLDEVSRCQQLGIGLYNFHPGSTLGKITEDECIKRVADSINWVHEQTKDVVAVVEITAGQGNCIGYSIDHLAAIKDQVSDLNRFGVCLDTAHMFAAGYDVSTKEGWEKVLAELDQKVGLQYLKGMHLNDSKAELGSRKDQHENIGKGKIGLECFKFVMTHSAFDNIPLILETPVTKGDKDAWKSVYSKEIQLLKSLCVKKEEEVDVVA